MNFAWIRPSAHQQIYSKMLYYEHRWFDIKGLTTQSIYTVELSQVYVKLKVAAVANQSVRHDPFLNQATEGIDVWEYMQNYQRPLVILGAPGSGKTTLLKNVVLTLLDKRSRREAGVRSNKIPVFLYLRGLADAIWDNNDIKLSEIVHGNLKQIHGRWEDVSKKRQPCPSHGWIEKQIRRGRCLIVLDGLDEVGDPKKRRRVVAWVQKQLDEHSSNFFVITSRPGGYERNPLQSVNTLEVQSFNARQQREFIDRWYLAQELMSTKTEDIGVRARAANDAEDLFNRIRGNSDISALAVNPLTLTMIANVHRFRNQLPGRRVELYSEICDVFLGQWRARKGFKDGRLTSDQKISVLQPLAFRMMELGIREIELEKLKQIIEKPLRQVDSTLDPSIFVKIIEEDSGLLVAKEWGTYGFSHKTFQEYLAARYVPRTSDLLKKLVNKINDEWWHETILLYGAQNDVSEIVKACIDAINIYDLDKSTAPLELGIKCIDERMSINPDVENEFRERVKVGVESANPTLANYFRKGFLNLRLSTMKVVNDDAQADKLKGLNDDTQVDDSLITRAEYQIFIDQYLPLVEHQPDHWDTTSFMVGRGSLPVLGVRVHDALQFCDWLTKMQDGVWAYQLPTADMLNDIHIQQPYWFVDDDGAIVSTNRAHDCMDYREAFKMALAELESAMGGVGTQNSLVNVAKLSLQTLDDKEVKGNHQAYDIDDRIFDLARYFAKSNVENLTEIIQAIRKTQKPRDYWKTDFDNRNSATSTQERASIADVRRIIEWVIESSQNATRKRRYTLQQSPTEAMKDLVQLCEASELISTKIEGGFTAFAGMEVRRAIADNVNKLSIVLRETRKLIYNHVYPNNNPKNLLVLRNIELLEEITEQASRRPIGGDKILAASKLITELIHLSDESQFKEMLVGRLTLAMLRNAAIWQLVGLARIRQSNTLPRRVLARNYIQILCFLLVVEVQANMQSIGRFHRKRPWGNSKTNEKAIAALLDVNQSITQIITSKKDENLLEGILLSRRLKNSVLAEGSR